MTTVEPIRDLEHIKRLKKFFKKNNPRDLVMFTMGINCGLRISDIVALNIADVKDKKYIRIMEKKTGKQKSFPINSKLKTMLKKYIKGKKEDEALFKSRFENRMDRFSAYRIIKSACKDIGLEEKVGTHTMRKTFGYHHYKKYKDVAMLQKIFNHSSPQITLRYIGIEQDEIDKSYRNFTL